MMRKLLKHEFIATGRIMGLIYAIVALITGYVLVSYYVSSQKDELSVGQTLGLIVIVLVSMCMFILTTVIMITNFQKSLYGDQGYLSFTLPVKSVSLLASKVIVSAVWLIAALVCFLGTMLVYKNIMKEDLIGFDFIEAFLTGLLKKSPTTLITFILLYIISLFVSFTMITMEIYFAITVANTRLFQKHHTIWTLVFSGVIIAITAKISSLIADAVDFGLLISEDGISVVSGYYIGYSDSMFLNLVSAIVSIVFTALFFYLTFYLMSKKINLS